MSDYEQAARADDPAESGALEETDAGRQPGGGQDEPTESGALEAEQQGKGYGSDEGERGGAFGGN